MSARTTRPRHAKPSAKAPLRASRGAAAGASAVIVAALTVGAVTPALATPALDSVDVKPASVSNDGTPDFSGHTADPGALVEVLVDGSAILAAGSDPVDGSWSIAGPAVLDGDHTYVVQVDGAPLDSGSFTTDTTAPAIVPDYSPVEPVEGEDVVVSANADADAVRFTYAVDGGVPVDTTEPTYTVSGLAAGTHTVVVRAFDALDNATGNHTLTIEVAEATPADETAPVVLQAAGPDGSEDLVEGDDAYFAFTADEDVTWAYTFDGAPVVGEDGDDVAFFDLGLGAHTLVVVATDAAGNASTPLTIGFTVVAAPEAVVPTIAWVSKPEASTTSTSAHFAVSVTDGAQVEYVLDLPIDAQAADALSVDGTEFTLTGLSVGHHKIMVAAVLGDEYSDVLTYEWDVTAPSPVVPPTAPPAPASPVLDAGSIPAVQLGRGIGAGATGQSVQIIQRVVGATPDGIFGRQTAAAVRSFQRAHGLVADGVVGPRTWAAMVHAANGGVGAAPVTSTSVPRAVINRGVQMGAHGQAVATIQQLLGITADGVFGPRTAVAVRSFQSAHGLLADGIVGRLTWAALTASS